MAGVCVAGVSVAFVCVVVRGFFLTSPWASVAFCGLGLMGDCLAD